MPARLWRLLLFFVIALMLLIVIAVTGVILYLTPARVENLVEKLVQDNLHRPLEFDAVHFSLFNGFVFKNISLPPDSAQQDQAMPLHSFYARELSLRYSLGELLHRRFIITSALVDSPRIALVVLPTQDSIAQQQEPQTDSLAANSPIAVDLRSFRLRNAQITVDVPDSASNQHLFLSDISCSLEDVQTPRGVLLEQQKQVRGRFKLKCENSVFSFSQKTPVQSLDVDGVLNVDLDMVAKSLQHITLRGSIGVMDVVLQIPDMVRVDAGALHLPILAEMQGVLNVIDGHIQIDPASLFVDDVSWVDVELSVNNFLTQPSLRLQVQRSRIPIEQFIRIAGTVLPDSLMPDIYLHNPDAFLSLAGTEISGTLPDSLGSRLDCVVRLHLRDFGATLNSGEYLLQNFNFTSSTRFALGMDAVHHPDVTVTVDIDSLAAALPDSLTAFAGRTHLDFSAKFNDDFMPSSLRAKVAVANFLGADFSGDVDLGAETDLDDLYGRSHFDLRGFDLSALAASPVHSTLRAEMDITLNGLDDIGGTIAIHTDSVVVEQEFKKTAFAPISFNADLRAQTDKQFKLVRIPSISASVNDFLTLNAKASANMGKKIEATLDVTDATLKHEALLAFLPEELTNALAGLHITGSTSLDAAARVAVSAEDTTFHVQTKIKTRDFNIDYLRQFVTLNGVNITIGAQVNSDQSGDFTFDLLIDSTKTSNLPQSVFHDNHIRFAASLSDFNTVRLDSGSITLPDLRTTGAMTASVRMIDDKPTVSADIQLHQSAEDTIFITRDILYAGHNDLDISVHSDTAIARLSVNVKTKDLTVNLPGGIKIDRINSDISVDQAVEMSSGLLIGDGGVNVRTPTGSLADYLLYRNYFSNAATHKSLVKIRKITAASYVLENAHIEAFIGYGRVEVPYMSIDLYGGNIGGAFSLSLNAKDIMDSPYKLSLHFSGINSALLLPTQRAHAKGLITAHAELAGRGFDIEKGIDLDGYFHITKIESKVADNLLRSLDPEGKDSGIRSTRLLINRCFKPRLFSFEIRHGYCYPAVFFDQPWYFPVRLSGGSIDLGRIPIAFFLKTE